MHSASKHAAPTPGGLSKPGSCFLARQYHEDNVSLSWGQSDSALTAHLATKTPRRAAAGGNLQLDTLARRTRTRCCPGPGGLRNTIGRANFAHRDEHGARACAGAILSGDFAFALLNYGQMHLESYVRAGTGIGTWLAAPRLISLWGYRVKRVIDLLVIARGGRRRVHEEPASRRREKLICNGDIRSDSRCYMT